MVREMKALVFDLFGTLITGDSDRVAHEALSKALADAYNGAFSWEEHLRLYDELVMRGMSSLDAAWEALLELLRRSGLKPSIGKDVLAKMHADFHAKYAKLRSDALEALRRAKEGVDRVGLVTDGDGEIVYAILEATGIKGFFSAVITFEDCGVRKPNPRLFLTCLKELGVSPIDAVMIGDRCVDVEGSVRAGMKAVLLGDARGCSVKPQAEARSLLEAVNKALILLGLR